MTGWPIATGLDPVVGPAAHDFLYSITENVPPGRRKGDARGHGWPGQAPPRRSGTDAYAACISSSASS